MTILDTNHDPRPGKPFQPTIRETGARLSSVLLNRATLAAGRQMDRPGGETLLWLLLGAGCVLWPLTQTYQQATALVDGAGLERLACHALCSGARATPCALNGAGAAACRGRATLHPTDEATRRSEQTATIRSAGQLFSAVAWGAALSSTSLR